MMTSINKDIRKRRSKSLGDTLLTKKRIKSSLAQVCRIIKNFIFNNNNNNNNNKKKSLKKCN